MPADQKRNLDFSKSTKPSEKKIIFVYGGSQGAVNVIKNFLLMLNTLNYKHLASIKLIIQSPKEFFLCLCLATYLTTFPTQKFKSQI